MTQEDLNSGRLVVEIGVAPTRPAEFAVFRLFQWTADRDDDQSAASACCRLFPNGNQGRASSKRSASITLVQAATKSSTNFSPASSPA